MSKITFWSRSPEPHAKLSNFYPVEIVGQLGIVYPSAEHAYQAAKCLRLVDKYKIAAIPEARDAKREGGKVPTRDAWDQVKDAVMLRILKIKFDPQQHPELAKYLKDTGSSYLEHYAGWEADSYWGIGKYSGKNRLGQLLMQLRETL